LTAKDLYNNIQIHQLDTFVVALTKDTTSVFGSVTPQSNGIYKIEYTLSSVGIWRMDITIQINGLGSPLQILNSPFEVTLD